MPEQRRTSPGTSTPTVLAAALLWTLVVLFFLLVPIGDQGTLLDCMGLVGRSARCEAAQQVINDAEWRLHTLPMLLAMVSGYVVIALLALRARRHRAGRAG